MSAGRKTERWRKERKGQAGREGRSRRKEEGSNNEDDSSPDGIVGEVEALGLETVSSPKDARYPLAVLTHETQLQHNISVTGHQSRMQPQSLLLSMDGKDEKGKGEAEV